jgi:hypothetical protein
MSSELMVPDNESVALNNIRLRAPRDIAEALTDVLMEKDERVRLRSTARFVELVTKRLCDLFNSEYFFRPAADAKLERRLRLLKEKQGKLAFGDLAGALDEFSKLLPDGYVMPELRQVFEAYVPESVSSAIKAIDTLIDAREEFEIPVSRLGAYVAMRMKGQSAGRNRVSALLWRVSRIRNAFAHPEGRATETTGEQDPPLASQGKSWWVETPEFYALLNGYLVPAIKGWLLWAPMYALLTRYEVVLVRNPVIQEGGRYRAQCQRYQLVPPFPPGDIVSSTPFESDTQVVARVLEQSDDLEMLLRVRRFPAGREDRPRLAARYLADFAHAFCNDARIDDQERQALLALRTESDLSESEARDIEEKVINRWLRACRPGQTTGRVSVLPPAGESRRHLLAWLCSDEEEPNEQASLEAAGVLGALADSLIGIIRNDGVMSISGLTHAAGLPVRATSFVLERLIAEQKVARVGRVGEDVPDAMYQHRDPTDWIEFVGVLETIRAEHDRGAAVPGFVGRLLKLTRELLLDAGHQPDGKVDADYNLLLSLVRDVPGNGRATAGQPVETTERDVEPLRVFVDGQALEDSGVAGLIRRVMGRVRNDPRLHAAMDPAASEVLPFKAGRSRYFVSLSAEHLNGTPFQYAIKEDVAGTTLHFEGNFPREVAQYHLQRFLEACGFTGRPVEDGAIRADEIGVAPPSAEVAVEEETEQDGDGADSPAYADLPGICAMSGDTVEFEARGETVPRFFEAFLRVLTSKGFIDKIDLPFAMGRVRYLLAEAPFHRDGRPFLRQVAWDGVYAEASIPWEAALDHASRVCATLGFESKATQPSAWSSATNLAVRLDTGLLVDGEDVRSFARRLMDMFRDDGILDDVLGWKTGGVRYLVWVEPHHAPGRDFKLPLEYVTEDKKYFVECQASRQQMLNYALRLLKEKGYKVAAVGEEARTWSDSMDSALLPTNGESDSALSPGEAV